MNKTTKRILYFVVVLFLVAIMVYPKLPKSSDQTEAVSDSPASNSLSVSGMIIQPEPLENNLRITGTIQADETVDLNSEVSAKIEGLFFEEGQSVSKGQLLITLNDDELQAELTKLQFTKKLTEDNEFRQRQLLEKEAISQEEYETSLNELNTSDAEIQVIKARLAKHKIVAPFNGTIGLRNVSIGSYINPGDLIARVYKINPVKLDFAIPGRYLNKVDPGDNLLFTVDAYGETFEGTIYAIEPRVDPDTRNLRIRAKCSNPKGKLLPGQFAKINLILETINRAYLVPTECIIPELDGKKVFVLENGLVAGKMVETGIRTDKMIQVVQGLQEGDTVITSGILQIRQGMPVNVTL